MKSLEKRITEIEQKARPAKPLKFFIEGTDGKITGDGMTFKTRKEYDTYSEQQGFKDGDRIKAIIFSIANPNPIKTLNL